MLWADVQPIYDLSFCLIRWIYDSSTVCLSYILMSGTFPANLIVKENLIRLCICAVNYFISKSILEFFKFLALPYSTATKNNIFKVSFLFLIKNNLLVTFLH